MSMRGLLLLLALLAALLWWSGLPRDRANTQHSDSAAGSPRSDQKSATAPSGPAAAGRAVSDAPRTDRRRSSGLGVPAADAPMWQQIRYWSAEAKSGDRYAQCQFARQVQLCAPQLQMFSREAYAQFIAANPEVLARGDLPDCSGVGHAEIDQALDQLYRAAANGHQQSQLLIAAGGLMSPVPDVQHIERLRRYREHAGALAWRAFDSGNSDAALLLWRAYNRVGVDFLPLLGAIAPDPVKAHALDLLMVDLLPGHPVGDARAAGLDDEQLQQARTLLADWRAHAFAQPKPPRHGTRFEAVFEWEKRTADPCADDDR